jgi:hypothetical protein
MPVRTKSWSAMAVAPSPSSFVYKRLADGVISLQFSRRLAERLDRRADFYGKSRGLFRDRLAQAFY